MSFRISNSSSKYLQREFRFFQPVIKEVIKEIELNKKSGIKTRKYDQVTTQNVSITFDKISNIYRFVIKKPENVIYLYQVWDEENKEFNNNIYSFSEKLRYWIDSFIVLKQNKGFNPTTVIEINDNVYISILVNASFESINNEDYCVLYFDGKNVSDNIGSISKNIPEGEFLNVRFDIDSMNIGLPVPSNIQNNPLYAYYYYSNYGSTFKSSLYADSKTPFTILDVTNNNTIFSGNLYCLVDESIPIAKAQWVSDSSGNNNYPIYPFPNGKNTLDNGSLDPMADAGFDNIYNPPLYKNNNVCSGFVDWTVSNPFSVTSKTVKNWQNWGIYCNQLLFLDGNGKITQTVTTPITYVPDNEIVTISNQTGQAYVNGQVITDPTAEAFAILNNTAGISFLYNNNLYKFWYNYFVKEWNYIIFGNSYQNFIDLAGQEAYDYYQNSGSSQYFPKKSANVIFSQ